MQVDRSQFEHIVKNLMRQKPATRKQERTGSPKRTGKIIPSTQAADRQPDDGKSEAKS